MWISIHERTPPQGWIVARLEQLRGFDAGVYALFHLGSAYNYYDGGDGCDCARAITHWLPLPEYPTPIIVSWAHRITTAWRSLRKLLP